MTLSLIGYALIAAGVVLPSALVWFANKSADCSRKVGIGAFVGAWCFGKRKGDIVAKAAQLLGILALVVNVAAGAVAATGEQGGRDWYREQVCGQQGNAVECRRLIELEHSRDRNAWDTLAKQATDIAVSQEGWVWVAIGGLIVCWKGIDRWADVYCQRKGFERRTKQ